MESLNGLGWKGCGGLLVMDQGVNVLQGECSSWRTVFPSSGVYAELPLVFFGSSLCGLFGLQEL